VRVTRAWSRLGNKERYLEREACNGARRVSSLTRCMQYKVAGHLCGDARNCAAVRFLRGQTSPVTRGAPQLVALALKAIA
jgi:hypothetical protein